MHPFLHIDGLMFAVSAAPEIPMPEAWLPLVVKNQGDISQQDVDQITSLLLELLKSRLTDIRDERFLLPQECDYTADGDNQALKLWLTGLLFGHQQLEGIWQDAWQQMLDKDPDAQPDLKRDLSHCLRMFSTFADPQLAVSQAEQRGNSELSAKLPIIFQSFSKALKQYVDISGKLVGYIPNQFEMYQEPINKS